RRRVEPRVRQRRDQRRPRGGAGRPGHPQAGRGSVTKVALLSCVCLVAGLAAIASCSSSGADTGAPRPDGGAGAGAGESGAVPPLTCAPLAADTAFAPSGVWRTPDGFVASSSSEIRVRGLAAGGVLVAAGNALAKVGPDGV